MAYSQLEYYQDELTQWLRIVAFHKGELQGSLRQVNLMLGFPDISLSDSKVANALIDRLMVQQQQFDHVFNHITSQADRLLRNLATARDPDFTLSEHQESLRRKMKSYEMHFIKTRYDCSIFLSSYFQMDSVSQVKG